MVRNPLFQVNYDLSSFLKNRKSVSKLDLAPGPVGPSDFKPHQKDGYLY
jgi:hypothetical protein